MKPKPQPNDEGTGLPGLRSWRKVYVFVLTVFAFWIGLLIVLTRMLS